MNPFLGFEALHVFPLCILCSFFAVVCACVCVCVCVTL
jgi:hypothetical protein